jgi:DNA mismatch repair ATPase MutS
MQHQMQRAKANDVHRLQASVVNRDMVAVVTRGTMTDAEMLSRHPDASFLLALAEAPAAAVDPAIGALDMSSPPCNFRPCRKCLSVLS